MSRAAEAVRRFAYLAFLFLVLAPVALLCYCAAAVARTAVSNVVAGWRDHK